MKKVLALTIGALCLSACGVELGFPGGTSGGSSSGNGAKGDGLVIFVTADDFDGNFNGAATADAECGRDPNNPDRANKTFRALIADSSRTPSISGWPIKLNTQYIRPDRTIIGKTDNTSRLLPTRLQNAIVSSRTNSTVWTGMNNDGTPAPNDDCNDWGTNLNATGRQGNAAFSSGYLSTGTVGPACSGKARFICVEQ